MNALASARILRVERDADLGERRRDLRHGRLDGRLLVLEILGNRERVVIIGPKTEDRTRLLNRCPCLLLLFNGNLQRVVSLVELFLTDATVRQKLFAPCEVIPRQFQARLPAFECGELRVQRGNLAP